MRRQKAAQINPRPGVAVCICGKNGVIIRHDPGGYARTMREQFARAREEKKEEKDDDGG